ncbi:hypothetical protein CP967_08670 [Streptomyces nitrosporeus]|uniref:Phage tail tape measure protein n=1 Tax=Streptomyces nitrosporeus TaxID=28894 RepID=A0A5J6FAG1_9ACTN|nr:hypothetical protein [Streptomyces nitrosporeus]QEU72035.1 hypothetical protein CP967_08670 [Streptomyces nitrosporeus]GGY81097.1 hypothetical protein GCM10010327_09660 [Streptomyces nitrosporeus]
MAERLTFVLDGRDGLTPVLRRAGESAEDFRRRLQRAARGADDDIRTFTRGADGRLRELNGRFISAAAAAQVARGAVGSVRQSTADWSTVADRASTAGGRLVASLISLAPAAIPVAASLAPLAAGAGAVAVAMGAVAAAVVPQILALTEAAEAEKKYTDAVAKSGKTSQEAVTAQVEYARVMADLPPAAREAAASLSVLKDEYKAWSASLSGDTLAPVVKGLSLLSAALPATTGLVRGTSRELDRMLTILAGGMASPGLDGLNRRFTDFATGTLARVNTALVNLIRTSDGARVGGGLSEFMAYARAQGPVVADTLGNIGDALKNVLVGASGIGVSMLDIIRGLSGIAAAIPPEAVSTVLQLVVALKLARIAAAGMGVGQAALAAFTAELVAVRAAAAAAPTRLGAVTAGIGAMSRTARLAVAGVGLGLLVFTLEQLSSRGKNTAPDIDKLSASMGRFADSGKVAGEAARVFGKDLSSLLASLHILGATTTDDFFKKFKDSPVSLKDAKKEVEALDQSLAGLVGSGKADLAAAALSRIRGQMGEAGYAASGLESRLTEYKEALEGAAFEQQLAAQSMGLFGAQAQQVQAKLDAQKASADGLRQSIQALNDQHRVGLGGMIGFEAAVDAATAAIKGNRDALSMSGGQLNLNSEKARTAATALNDLAAKTDEAAAQARQSGASWSTVTGIYARGRSTLIRTADAMGLNRAEAKALADQILRTPDKTAKLKGNLEDLQAKLGSAKAQLKSVPDSRRAKVLADISDLKNKIANAERALANLRDKSVTITTRYVTVGDSSAARKAGSYGSTLKYASGGLVGYPGGGMVTGPGTGTSDSILAQVSNGEFVVRAKSVAKYGARFLAAINEGRLGMASTMSGAGGSLAGAGVEAGRGLSAGLRGATAGVDASARVMAAAVTAGVRAELEIASPSKKMQALMKDVGKGLILGLTGSKEKIKATARDLVADIWKAWEGVKTSKDSKLVALVTKDTKKLQALATARDKIAARIDAANKYRAELTSNAKSAAGLSNLGLADEEVTAGSIQAGLQQKLNKINQFARYIKTLAKRGLSKSLLQQVLNMGPDQGYAYASALAGMGTSALKAINTTQGHLDKAANTLGGLGADVMYDSGKNAGKGYLKGLDSQQDAIEKQMVKIAKAMDKAIRKALGIKSPSTVAAVSGGYFTEGIAKGAVDQLPVLDRAMGAVAGRMSGMRPVIGRPAVAGAGVGGVVYNINVVVHEAMDPVAVGREMQRVLVRYGRAQGATVSLNVGR